MFIIFENIIIASSLLAIFLFTKYICCSKSDEDNKVADESEESEELDNSGDSEITSDDTQ